MQSFRLDPYLWVHLAGLAAVPLWFDVCLLGLAAGDPILPVWLELGVLIAIGVLPVLWMQWQRPFCIFSLVVFALRPDQISPSQRRLLHLFRDPIGRGISLLVPLPLIWGLWQIYRLAPLAADYTPFPNRGVGVLIAAIAFLLVNLFTQVPIRVLRVLLAPATALEGIDPYAPEAIAQDFTLIGLRVNRILPPLDLPSVEAPPEAPPQPAVADQQEPEESEEPVPAAGAEADGDEMDQTTTEAETASEVDITTGEATADTDKVMVGGPTDAALAAPAPAADSDGTTKEKTDDIASDEEVTAPKAMADDPAAVEADTEPTPEAKEPEAGFPEDSELSELDEDAIAAVDAPNWPVDDSVEALDYEGTSGPPESVDTQVESTKDDPEDDPEDGADSSSAAAEPSTTAADGPLQASDSSHPGDINGYHPATTDTGEPAASEPGTDGQPPQESPESGHESSPQSLDDPGEPESRSE